MTTVMDFFARLFDFVSMLFNGITYAATQWWCWAAIVVLAGVTLWWVNAATRRRDQSRIDNEGDPL